VSLNEQSSGSVNFVFIILRSFMTDFAASYVGCNYPCHLLKLAAQEFHKLPLNSSQTLCGGMLDVVACSFVSPAEIEFLYA
jgi:hypothetical protein